MKPKRFNAKRACIEQLEREGFFAHDAERRNRFGTLDWEGWADVVAWRPMKLDQQDETTLKLFGARISPLEWIAVQVTTRQHLQEHLDKLATNKRIGPRWIALGLRAQIWLYPTASERAEGDTEPQRIEYKRHD